MGALFGIAKPGSAYGTYLETREGVTTHENAWYAESLLTKTGIFDNSTGSYYANVDCEHEKYGFRQGTAQEAADLGMKCIGKKVLENTPSASLLNNQSEDKSEKSITVPLASSLANSNYNPMMFGDNQNNSGNISSQTSSNTMTNNLF